MTASLFQKKNARGCRGIAKKRGSIPEARHPVRLNIRDEAKRVARQAENPVESVRYADVLSRARLYRNS